MLDWSRLIVLVALRGLAWLRFPLQLLIILGLWSMGVPPHSGMQNDTSEVEVRPLSHVFQTAETSGVLIPAAIALRPPFPGTVKQIMARPGQRVTAGQPLVILATDQIDQIIAREEADLELMHSQIKLLALTSQFNSSVKRAVSRIEDPKVDDQPQKQWSAESKSSEHESKVPDLQESDFVQQLVPLTALAGWKPSRPMDSENPSVTVLREESEKLRRSIQILRVQQQASIVCSPIDGVLLQVAHVGKSLTVSEGGGLEPVGLIEDDSHLGASLKIVAFAPPGLETGRLIEMKVEGSSTEGVTAEISGRVADKVNLSVRSPNVKTLIGHRITSIKINDSMLILPERVIERMDSTLAAVSLNINGIRRRTIIRIHSETINGQVVILEGLEPGDRVLPPIREM